MERQRSESISGIRNDHRARYELALSKIPAGSSVLDIACGCGYGSWMMHEKGHRVVGVDIDPETIEFARKHYPGPQYIVADALKLWRMSADVLVSLETIEHLSNPMALVDSCEVRRFIASTPNEECYSFNPEKFKGEVYPHLRHYTPAQFDRFIEDAGFHVTERYYQKSKSEWEPKEGADGDFLIYVAER